MILQPISYYSAVYAKKSLIFSFVWKIKKADILVHVPIPVLDVLIRIFYFRLSSSVVPSKISISRPLLNRSEFYKIVTGVYRPWRLTLVLKIINNLYKTNGYVFISYAQTCCFLACALDTSALIDLKCWRQLSHGLLWIFLIMIQFHHKSLNGYQSLIFNLLIDWMNSSLLTSPSPFKSAALNASSASFISFWSLTSRKSKNSSRERYPSSFLLYL